MLCFSSFYHSADLFSLLPLAHLCPSPFSLVQDSGSKALIFKTFSKPGVTCSNSQGLSPWESELSSVLPALSCQGLPTRSPNSMTSRKPKTKLSRTKEFVKTCDNLLATFRRTEHLPCGCGSKTNNQEVQLKLKMRKRITQKENEAHQPANSSLSPSWSCIFRSQTWKSTHRLQRF